jgi:hypothetical protein
MLARAVLTTVPVLFSTVQAEEAPILDSVALEAATAAVRRDLPAEWISDGRVDPRRIAADVLATVADNRWMPIATAPHDEEILLARRDGAELRKAVGRWLIEDEADSPGYWSTRDWWGQPPTHWAPLPGNPEAVE